MMPEVSSNKKQNKVREVLNEPLISSKRTVFRFRCTCIMLVSSRVLRSCVLAEWRCLYPDSRSEDTRYPATHLLLVPIIWSEQVCLIRPCASRLVHSSTCGQCGYSQCLRYMYLFIAFSKFINDTLNSLHRARDRLNYPNHNRLGGFSAGCCVRVRQLITTIKYKIKGNRELWHD